MKNKDKIIFPKVIIFLCIIIILGIIIIINLFPDTFFHNKCTAAIAIIGGADGPTTIYIAAKYNWILILIISVLLLMLDFILLAVAKLLERKKEKKIKLVFKGIIIFFVNLLLTVLLFPGMFVWSTLITAIMIIFIIIFQLRKGVKIMPENKADQ